METGKLLKTDPGGIFFVISPEGGRMDGQACLYRQADIRRATDSERHLCRELDASRNRIKLRFMTLRHGGRDEKSGIAGSDERTDSEKPGEDSWLLR